ncbi:MAG: flagellar filament capping protein FliD [Treponema sp.]|uniref:flagellar filament capping protein FliD n=1 Tax=Treponema sp. TaxID=166 RepID=UPI0025D0CDAC|nr:flagellar filament capping protein FliD [Treponema sp.]MBQ9281361.1 flagellar filament capping protein FliD [Treponema sp.]
MAEISIPGVSDKYKTNDYIDALMKKERIPLTREQESLDRYKEQQSAWRDVNQKMSALRDSTKTLYSFENPFNNKIASSTDERAITADPGRDAELESIKIDVIKEATADRFLSKEVEKSMQVPKGVYTFEIGEKKITFNYKGGKLTDFVTALNKRGANTLKASLVGVSNGKSALSIESLKTGESNRLVFKDDALTFALENKLVEKSKKDLSSFGTSLEDYENPIDETTLKNYSVPDVEQEGLPPLSKTFVDFDDNTGHLVIPPRSGFTLNIPEEYLSTTTEVFEFSYSTQEVEDITEELNIKRTTRPELPNVGIATFESVTVENEQVETNLPPISSEPLLPVTGHEDFYAHNKDGSETLIPTEKLSLDEESGEKTVSLQLKEYPDLESIVVRNRNTGTQINISQFSAYDEKKNLGYAPINPVSEAGDAIIKYEGITIKRPTNKIDDVVPHVTLNVHQPTKETATIDITSDKEGAKNSLIEFVGRYNQVLAEMTILSENKPEIISELDYLSDSEKEAAEAKLGMFQNDFSLTNGKSSLRSIVTANYRWSDDATVTMLNQIGISSRASGSTGGYVASQMRGYLEIDEKKLDSALEENMDGIKNLFGYDSDGDLVIDSGVAFAIDKQLTSWVQSGGIIATKNRGIDTKIKAAETNIRKLESQLSSKESQLRNKYGQMEGTLNNLNAQSSTINNFANGGRSQQ